MLFFYSVRVLNQNVKDNFAHAHDKFKYFFTKTTGEKLLAAECVFCSSSLFSLVLVSSLGSCGVKAGDCASSKKF